MGQPTGITQKQVQERNRIASRAKAIAAYTCAGLIRTALSTEDGGVDTLMDMHGLTEQEAQAVVAEMRAIGKRIDPDGDWTS